MTSVSPSAFAGHWQGPLRPCLVAVRWKKISRLLTVVCPARDNAHVGDRGHELWVRHVTDDVTRDRRLIVGVIQLKVVSPYQGRGRVPMRYPHLLAHPPALGVEVK
eukprot:9821351-Heterocapsa_arctica.AAC.1